MSGHNKIFNTYILLPTALALGVGGAADFFVYAENRERIQQREQDLAAVEKNCAQHPGAFVKSDGTVFVAQNPGREVLTSMTCAEYLGTKQAYLDQAKLLNNVHLGLGAVSFSLMFGLMSKLLYQNFGDVFQQKKKQAFVP